ncbi:MAG: hypothetical protein Q9218_007784 [Villophora microphyllina]
MTKKIVLSQGEDEALVTIIPRAGYSLPLFTRIKVEPITVNASNFFCVTDASLAALRGHYGQSKPEFAQINGIAVPLDTKEVVLAGPNGQKPRFATENNRQLLTARDFNQNYMFWTLDSGGKRYIIKYVGSYKAWLGMNQGFSAKTVVYPVSHKISTLARLSEDVMTMSISNRSSPDPSQSGEVPRGPFARLEELGLARKVPYGQGLPLTNENIKLSNAMNEQRMNNVSGLESRVMTLYNNFVETPNEGAIIVEDRLHYGQKLPPYVSAGYPNSQTSFVAVLADYSRESSDRQIVVQPRQWTFGYRYWSTTIDGQQLPVKKSRDDGEGEGFGLMAWYGHRDRYSVNPVAYFSHTITAPGHGRQSEIQLDAQEENPQTRTSSLHDDLDATDRRTFEDNEIVSQRSTESPTTTKLNPFNSRVKQLHKHFGSNKPPFVRSRKTAKVGETREVVKATSSGHYPESIDLPISTVSILAEPWTSEYFFWSIETSTERQIIAPFKREGKIWYRQWQGIDQGFTEQAVAYNMVEPAAEPSSANQAQGIQANLSRPEVALSTHVTAAASTGDRSTLNTQPAHPHKRFRDALSDNMAEDMQPPRSRPRVTTEAAVNDTTEEQPITTKEPANNNQSYRDSLKARKEQIRQRIHMLYDNNSLIISRAVKLCEDELEEVLKAEKEAS